MNSNRFDLIRIDLLWRGLVVDFCDVVFELYATGIIPDRAGVGVLVVLLSMFGYENRNII